MDLQQFDNPFVKQYIDYVEHTEPPRTFHIWAAMTTVSACMQRHLYLDTGIGRMFGNMYVLLVGPPGTRKGHAIKPAVNMMSNVTDVRFAPDDTGGQRQGLITSMIEDEEDEDNFETAEALSAEMLAEREIYLAPEDRHVLFVNATEFGSFIGQNALDLTRFLIKMWDGEDYQYRLRKSRDVLRDPLMTMIGGTTPTDIATLLPPEAIGQGFMSRCVLVYAPHKEKTVPLSKARLKTEYESELQKVYANVFYNMRGSMELEPGASKLLDRLYMQELKMNDSRFIYYAERRHTHLIKLTMAFTAARGSMKISEGDVNQADLLLTETEKRMPDALGEYGLSPLAQARQKILEFLRHAKEPVSERVLWVMMQRDMKLMDFKNTISGLVNADKIQVVDTNQGRAYMYADSLSQLLTTMGDDELDAIFEKGDSNDK